MKCVHIYCSTHTHPCEVTTIEGISSIYSTYFIRTYTVSHHSPRYAVDDTYATIFIRTYASTEGDVRSDVEELNSTVKMLCTFYKTDIVPGNCVKDHC